MYSHHAFVFLNLFITLNAIVGCTVPKLLIIIKRPPPAIASKFRCRKPLACGPLTGPPCYRKQFSPPLLSQANFATASLWLVVRRQVTRVPVGRRFTLNRILYF